MTKGMVGRMCGLGAVCCIALTAWADRSEAGAPAPVRSNAAARPKTTAHAIGSAEKHVPTGKASAAKHAATSKHAAKSSALKHGTLKAIHTQHAKTVVSHASSDRHHGRTKHGASMASGPAKKPGYLIARSAKPLGSK